MSKFTNIPNGTKLHIPHIYTKPPHLKYQVFHKPNIKNSHHNTATTLTDHLHHSKNSPKRYGNQQELDMASGTYYLK
jgi:hypothetical protein